MIVIAKNLRELTDEFAYLRTNCNHNEYPTEFQTFDEAWDSLLQSLDYLRGKLGEERHSQLVNMAEQAKEHYEANQADWASWLMQDMEQVVKGKPPFAYPKELYRWTR